MTAGCRQALGLKNPLATQVIQINFKGNPYMLTSKPATSRAVIPMMSPLVAKWFLLVRAIT